MASGSKGQSVEAVEDVPTTFDTMTGGTSTALARTDDEPQGGALRSYTTSPDFDPGEVIYPRLRLAQGLTQEVQDRLAQPGQWVLTGNDAVDTVSVVPVMFARARELRVKGSQGQDELACKSSDARLGVGQPGGDCARCPLAQWVEVPGAAKNRPPACSLIYSYVVWVVEHQQLASLEFKKTGTKAAQFINTMIQGRGLGNFAVKLGNSPQRGPQGPFYVPSTAIARVEPEELATARALAGIPDPVQARAAHVAGAQAGPMTEDAIEVEGTVVG